MRLYNIRVIYTNLLFFHHIVYELSMSSLYETSLDIFKDDLCLLPSPIEYGSPLSLFSSPVRIPRHINSIKSLGQRCLNQKLLVMTPCGHVYILYKRVHQLCSSFEDALYIPGVQYILYILSSWRFGCSRFGVVTIILCVILY